MQLASVKAADLCGLFPHVRSLCGTTIYFFLSCDTPFKCGEMAGFRNRILRSVDCIAGRQQELISTSMLHQTSLELSKIIKHGPIAESNKCGISEYISISPIYVNIQTGKMMIMMTNQVPAMDSSGFQGLPGLQRVWRGTTWLQPMGARPGHSEDSTDEKWGWVKLHMEPYGFTMIYHS